MSRHGSADGSVIRMANSSWIERACLPLMGVMSASITLLNFRAQHDFHTITKHLVFKERILHGFATTDVMPSYPIPPTFPMWGYGWVLLLTTNKLLLIALQIAVALFSVWFFLRILDEFSLLNRWSRIVLRIFMVFCIPWYAYNSFEWSQSLATSLLILSLSLLIRAAHRNSAAWWWLGLSAACFGLNLNLASDLYLLPFPLAFAYWWYTGPSRAATARATWWLAGVVFTLVPWMTYTWHATGTPLVKSTNQGHVLFIGLGQDPQRRFGVTYSDADPKMYQILRDQLGETLEGRLDASCSYEADAVLRRAFVQLVTDKPRTYLNLVWFRLRQILSGEIGTYSGEFDEGENVGSFGIGAPLRTLVRRVTQRAGTLLQLGTTLFVPAALWAALRRRRAAWAFVLLPIAYQYLSGSVAVLQPQYLSNLILLQLLVCAHGLGTAFSFLLEKRWMRECRTTRFSKGDG